MPKLWDVLMKNPDPGPSAIDLLLAERGAYDEELGARMQYQRVVEKLADFMGCDG